MARPISKIAHAFELAREQYAGWGVDVNAALKALAKLSISVQCWQGDDVQGFEGTVGDPGGGLKITGGYPGRARNVDELRQDLEQVFSLVAGKHRVALHAMYGESLNRHSSRACISPKHFEGWVDWAREQNLGLDFNPTFFSHGLAKDGFTLSHPDQAIRDYWIAHGQQSRTIGAYFGGRLGQPCVTNFWIPDGYKDTPVDRKGPRLRLLESLDAIFSVSHPESCNLDSVESKLFGIGAESYTVGSHEFYYGYAITRKKLICLDTGHFHPTESLADKISAVFPYVPGMLLHVSRGVRWDSDHVVTFTDDLRGLASEIVRGNFLERTYLGLDFFDASINRLAAWTIGIRSLQKAMLGAFLEPLTAWREAEQQWDFTRRLALQEEITTLPLGVVWDYFCMMQDVPIGLGWLSEIDTYEKAVLRNRI